MDKEYDLQLIFELMESNGNLPFLPVWRNKLEEKIISQRSRYNDDEYILLTTIMNGDILFVDEKKYIEKLTSLPFNITVNSLYEKKIQNLLSEMHSRKFEEASDLFNRLEAIQLFLAKLVFKEKVQLSRYLNEFITEYDRVDDPENKKVLFAKEINGSSEQDE